MTEGTPRTRDRSVRRIAAFATLPVGVTLLLHQLLGEPATVLAFNVSPLMVAPFDHVGPLEYGGQQGLAAFAVMTGSFLLLWRLLAWLLPAGVAHRPRAAAGFGLLVGGALSNATEVLLRGAALDWLWLPVGGNRYIVANAADAALATGLLLLVAAIVGDLWSGRESLPA